jgi:hypothetical protein
VEKVRTTRRLCVATSVSSERTTRHAGRSNARRSRGRAED